MAYIDSEQVKKIRKEIKTAFPNYVFSITREHYTGVRISILSGTEKLTEKETGYEDINVYYVESKLQTEPERAGIFSKILKIANQFQRGGYETGDYGHQPDYYVTLNVGEWDKPYQLVVKSSQPAVARKPEQVNRTGIKKIFARFGSKCAETGMYIEKGAEMYYDYDNKKCYSMNSNKANELEGTATVTN